MLVTKGQSLHYRRNQNDFTEIKFPNSQSRKEVVASKRFASASKPNKNQATVLKKFDQMKPVMAGRLPEENLFKIKNQHEFTSPVRNKGKLITGKDGGLTTPGIGKHKQSLMLTYSQIEEQRKLQQESLQIKSISGNKQSLVEQLRSRHFSKQQSNPNKQIFIQNNRQQQNLLTQGTPNTNDLISKKKSILLADMPNQLQATSYFRILPVQIEENSIRKKLSDRNRIEAMKQMQMRRMTQRRLTGTLSIDSKANLNNQRYQNRDITPLINGTRSTTSTLHNKLNSNNIPNIKQEYTAQKHHSNINPNSRNVDMGNQMKSSLSQKSFVKSSEYQTNNNNNKKDLVDFDKAMNQLAQQIQQFGMVAGRNGVVQQNKDSKTTFASLISSTLNLNNDQKAELHQLRNHRKANNDKNIAIFQNNLSQQELKNQSQNQKLNYNVVGNYTVQKQMQQYSTSMVGHSYHQQQLRQIANSKQGPIMSNAHHRSNVVVPFAKKMIMAGVNFNQHQINNILPTTTSTTGKQNIDFSRAINNNNNTSSIQLNDLMNISAIDSGGVASPNGPFQITGSGQYQSQAGINNNNNYESPSPIPKVTRGAGGFQQQQQYHYHHHHHIHHHLHHHGANRPHLKRLGGGGTELYHGGILQMQQQSLQHSNHNSGNNTSLGYHNQQQHNGMNFAQLGIGGSKIGIPSPQSGDKMTIRFNQTAMRRAGLSNNNTNLSICEPQGQKLTELQKYFQTQPLQINMSKNNIGADEILTKKQIIGASSSRQASPSDNNKMQAYSKNAKRNAVAQQYASIRRKKAGLSGFDDPMTAIAIQDVIDHHSPSPKPAIVSLNSLTGSPNSKQNQFFAIESANILRRNNVVGESLIHHRQENFKDSLIKLRETAAINSISQQSSTQRDPRDDELDDHLMKDKDRMMMMGVNRFGANRYKIQNKPPLVKFNSRHLSPTSRKANNQGTSSPAKLPKVKYKFPQTGFGKAIDILNYQILRYELNPLHFQKDTLINICQQSIPEPTLNQVERQQQKSQNAEGEKQTDDGEIDTDSQQVGIFSNKKSQTTTDTTKLKQFIPINKQYTHLRNEKLNIILRLVNAFNSHVFKRKNANPDINFVLKLSKVLNLKINRSQLTKQPQILKNNKDLAIAIRDRLISTMHQAINQSNGMIVQKTPGHVKFYVNKGNNAMLVRSIMKKRWWWTMIDKEDVQQCNVIWTQWRKNKIIQKIKTLPPGDQHLFNDSSVADSTTTATTAQHSDRKFSSHRLLRNNSLSQGEDSGLTKVVNKMKAENANTEQQQQQQQQQLEQSKIQPFELDQEGLKQQTNKEIISQKKETSNNNINTSRQIDVPQQCPLIPTKIPNPRVYPMSSIKIYNRMEDNFHISNKKAMFINLMNYYQALGRNVFDAVPVTFHIQNGVTDPQFDKFVDYFKQQEEKCKQLDCLLSAQKTRKKQSTQQHHDSGSDSDGEQQQQQLPQNSSKLSPTKGAQSSNLKSRKNIWIVKPGENSNRGNGINICKSIDEIQSLITNYYQNKKNHTVILQQYIDRPLLINKRKFDIRCFCLVTSINGYMKAFAYNEGYVRTSSREYKLKNLKDKVIHLTNDAIQKKSDDYGKFEAANKISYSEFQRYIDANFPEKGISFYKHINTQIKRLQTDVVRSVYGKMDPQKRINTFEIFGYDFMVDENFKVYLIEVNTNPDISLCCPLLAMLIPNMLDNAFRIAIDPLFPAPDGSQTNSRSKHSEMLADNKFQLVFDQRYDGAQIKELMKDRAPIEIMDEQSCEEDSSEDEAVGDDDQEQQQQQ